MSQHCCDIMDKMLAEDYLHHTITFSTDGLKVYPPQIPGPTLTERGRKHKPNIIIAYCPFCGRKLTDDPAFFAGTEAAWAEHQAKEAVNGF